MVQDLLSVDPHDRPTVAEVLQNRLFASGDVPALSSQLSSLKPSTDRATTLAKKSVAFMMKRPADAPVPPPAATAARHHWQRARANTAAQLRWRLLRVHLQRIVRQNRTAVCASSALVFDKLQKHCEHHLPLAVPNNVLLMSVTLTLGSALVTNVTCAAVCSPTRLNAHEMLAGAS
jgi:hypothetical protein